MSAKNPNHLKNETSPYLLQHVHNPVDWYPWGEEALKKAKDEDKPIILSIGYSSCHWCHVMEKESFENDTVAKIMNDHYVCIKVDREERPDIDQIYMDAVQAMGIHGGWPLNVFLTPDQKPFYGGTYFPVPGWVQLLMNINTAYKKEREKVEDSANQFIQTISLSETVKYGMTGQESEFDMIILDEAFQKFSTRFDLEKGGVQKAPKFPMPNNWLFLLRYHQLTGTHYALEQLKLTLDQMAFGGIYDQVGGGFARYSVDDRWFAPHFEKMLYDNGQLVSLYSEAYQATKNLLYKDVVYQTVDWVEREMSNGEGGFYSALDADSDGVEGKFYTWTQEELQEICGDEIPLISAYYNTTAVGNWEEGRNILFRKLPDHELAKQFGLTPDQLEDKVADFRLKALGKRDGRVRPGLDDKVLTGWNAIMLRGLVDAYRAFGDDKFLHLALRNARFIKDKMKNGEGLYRTYKEGTAKIDAYLEDYGMVIDAYAALYQVTFDESWLEIAKHLTQYTIDHFYDESESLFYYTSDSSEKLVARKKEIFDNVIPASNSIMANNLFIVGTLVDNQLFKDTATKMLAKVTKMISKDVNYLSNWAVLMTYLVKPYAEIIISGSKLKQLAGELNTHYLPNKIVMGTEGTSDLALLKGRAAKADKTLVYVCYDKTCQLPVETVKDALDQLKQ